MNRLFQTDNIKAVEGIDNNVEYEKHNNGL